ncbi:hypothetical protein BDV40DRAFT_252303 [Aspergillus tamarii]|uniref:Uncharacterized protein n=1 Tax=Aspergillus tamarii TaxID=41984 RepID=A0A5N6VBL8_ASPTM|nr:hypothetical protein BDV40DRAFT_252303 [Aspergillus tamarii]
MWWHNMTFWAANVHGYSLLYLSFVDNLIFPFISLFVYPASAVLTTILITREP